MAKDTDWLSLEKEWSTDNYSNTELAKKYGITEGAIRDRVKRYGWVRDLSSTTATSTRAKLLRNELRLATSDGKSTGKPPTEREIIDRASDTRVEIIEGHRYGTARLRDVAERLTDAAEQIVEGGIAEPTVLSKMVASIEGLGRIHDLVIKQQRQSYNLDAEPPAPATAPMPQLERLSALLLSQLDARRRAPVTVGPATIEHVPGGKK